MAFRIPISRVRSITAAYIDWKITRKPMIRLTPITTPMNGRNPGSRLGVIMLRYSSVDCTVYFSMPG